MKYTLTPRVFNQDKACSVELTEAELTYLRTLVRADGGESDQRAQDCYASTLRKIRLALRRIRRIQRELRT